jgi:hypothetical protein
LLLFSLYFHCRVSVQMCRLNNKKTVWQTYWYVAHL